MVDLEVGAVPALAGTTTGTLPLTVEDRLCGPVGQGIGVDGMAVKVERKAIGQRLTLAGEHAEVLVEGVVLLHDDDDVFDGVARVGRADGPV